MILTVPAILVFYVYFFGGFYFFFFGLLSLVAGRGVTILAHGAFGPSEKRLIFLIIIFFFCCIGARWWVYRAQHEFVNPMLPLPADPLRDRQCLQLLPNHDLFPLGKC